MATRKQMPRAEEKAVSEKETPPDVRERVKEAAGMRLTRKLPHLIISALVLLLPLWFLPVTQNIVSYQKQALLVVGVFLALVAWLARSINDGEIVFRKSRIHLLVLGVLLAAGISAVSSIWPYASLWGWPLSVTDSFLTLLGFAGLYFLIVFSVRSGAEVFRIENLLVAGGFLAVLIALLQTFGVYLLPFASAQSTGFNTVGSVNSIAILASVLIPFCLMLIRSASGLRRVFLWVAFGLFFTAVAFINFQTAWVTLISGAIVVFSFSVWNFMRGKQETSGISLPMALIVLALFFSFFRVPIPGRPSLPVEVSPSQREEINIARRVLAEAPLTGSGPGTFVLDFARYRSPELNQTIFWGTRFDAGASSVLDWLVTKGAFGILALLSLMGVAIASAVKGLARGKNGQVLWYEGVGLLAALTGLTVAQFLYPANFTLWFFFWVFLGLLAISLAGPEERISIAPPSLLALASSFVFLLVLIFGLGLLFVGGQKYYAEMVYFQGVRAAQSGDADAALDGVQKAARLNPNMDAYWRDLSQLYLARINDVRAREDLSDEEKSQATQQLVSGAVQTANQASLSAPVNAANWVVRGFIYRNLIGIEGAEQFALESYEKAAELEPASPFNAAEMGRVNFLKAQSVSDAGQKKEYLEKAEERLNASLDLKGDYAPAHYLIALVYDARGKTDEAIAKLEETLRLAPQDVGLAFQLGMVYWQRGDMAKTQTALEAARAINPSYANARYMLGLVYERRGEGAKAIREFEKIAELNPGNAEVSRILENLKAGKSALEGLDLQAPPIQETPPEIQREGGSQRGDSEPGEE